MNDVNGWLHAAFMPPFSLVPSLDLAHGVLGTNSVLNAGLRHCNFGFAWNAKPKLRCCQKCHHGKPVEQFRKKNTTCNTCRDRDLKAKRLRHKKAKLKNFLERLATLDGGECDVEKTHSLLTNKDINSIETLKQA